LQNWYNGYKARDTMRFTAIHWEHWLIWVAGYSHEDIMGT